MICFSFSSFAGWRECTGVKSQFRNHEALVKKLLEDAREPHYRGFCIGNTDSIRHTYVLYRYRFTIECTEAKSEFSSVNLY